ncbi:hypothetical protein CAPTEDRAFT_214786 [Capitella teleta]|uniref:SAP domain-containing protein n=1 Tax=Capitella teleta TaxID=283909 RepID=R7UH85_CAPTE|nr:hypothetical protein CAPTEDRAFT_214786 [Capitella teleta]|eukprot:ELU05545.1 hypothetical protein CAPTEDRAFT_214786 [Capitella teleta]
MAQFGSGKNPPWARADGAVGLSAQQSSLAAAALQNIAAAAAGQQVGLPQGAMLTQQSPLGTQTVYTLSTTNPTLAPHQYTGPQLSMISAQPGIALPTTLATVCSNPQMATVSYPAPRGAPPPGPQPKQRVFTGTVTKLHENFGFVDEDVFFQTRCSVAEPQMVFHLSRNSSCVKGNLPKVGDRVLVEATYNINMPFKWNATRIQVLPNQPTISASGPTPIQPAVPIAPQARQNQGMVNMNQAPPNNLPQPPPLMGQPTQPTPGVRQANQSSRQTEKSGFRDRERERPRERERERDRDRHERRERRSPARKRSRSPRRSKSPSTSRATRSSPTPRRRTARVIPRYSVTIPKITLDTREANVMVLRSRYNNLYVPSDFFNAQFRWTEAFPIERPFNIMAHGCEYHVMSKDVEPLEKNEACIDPPDADHLFSAKVMLLSAPPSDELYHKSCALAEDPPDVQEAFQHPTRLLHFLVGLKGKEPMAIGGPWSPSLDGAEPLKDPRVLINTAIRTTRGLTGIDLSSCTQWYRFAEVRYHRPEEMHKGRLEEEEEGADNIAGENKEPTHFSELDPKTMKVADLRHELECRLLSSKGLKSQLIARLTKAIKSEEEKEEMQAEEKAEQEEKKEEENEKEEDKDEDKRSRDEEEKRRKEEKEAASRERRYTLPDQPSILVHPSTTAKSGKFDCTVMSLSLLLDYRQEDNKEHSFEVSLFAELFNEMLMRDFGYNIYKALLAAPEKKEDEKEKKKEKKEEKRDTEEPASKRRKSDREEDREEKEGGGEKSEEEEDDRDSLKERHRSHERERKKEKPRLLTVLPQLLLSFVYFDHMHTGYLVDKDVEEIFHILGLHLSRSQIKKQVKKVVLRDTLNYRKLTDKTVSKEEEKDETEEKKEAETETENAEKKIVPDDPFLLGNLSYLHSLEERSEAGDSANSSEGLTQDGASQPTAQGMVLYKGALLDIESFMQRLEKAEKTYTATEHKLKEVQEEMDMLKASFSSSEQNSQKVGLELQDLKKKLRDQRKATDGAESSAKKFHDLLARSQHTLQNLVHDYKSALASDKEDKALVKQEINGK